MNGHASDKSEIWVASRWSLFPRASAANDPELRRQALAELFTLYREPIERTLAHHLRAYPGIDSNAADLFAHCIEHDVFAKADPSRGRFRQYIQGVIRTYVLELRKRAGRRRHADVDEIDVEDRRGTDAHSGAEADDERVWALGVLETALTRLGELRPDDERLLREHYLSATPRSTADIAAARGVSLETLHRALSRARSRLSPFLLEAAAEGSGSASEFDAEREWLEHRLMRACPGLYGER